MATERCRQHIFISQISKKSAKERNFASFDLDFDTHLNEVMRRYDKCILTNNESMVWSAHTE